MRKLLVLACCAFGPLFAAEPSPLIIAHRGASGYLPEHTLAAKAFAYAQGADYLEQDVVLSKDGVPIVQHDVTLDSTTDVAVRFPGRQRANGSFYALDFTLGELRQLRVVERFNPKTGKSVYPGRFPGGVGEFRINTFEEELQFIQGLNRSTGRRVGIYPEVKLAAWHRQEGHDISKAMLVLLEKYGYASKTDACFIQCFEWEELCRLRGELGWKGRLIFLTGGKSPWTDTTEGLREVAKVVDGIGPPLFAVAEGRNLTGLVARAQAAGLQVHPYTLRNDALPKGFASAREFFGFLAWEAKVDGLFSDFPDVGR
ncbi:glycerophosphoryl diester phosphodiesterase [Verrucomicrobiota bacterium]|nr:glycerophosphoryl diester phosphodiesterase [Verrucomicrobiota bacterium]